MGSSIDGWVCVVGAEIGATTKQRTNTHASGYLRFCMDFIIKFVQDRQEYTPIVVKQHEAMSVVSKAS